MSGDTPTLSRSQLDEIYAHARAGYPEEVCGFILTGAAGDEVRRCENRQNALHAEDPARFPRDARTAYNIGANDLFFLDRSLRSEHKVRVIYHSHVEVGAYFSDEDTRAATDGGDLLWPVDYLVVDVRADGVREARLYHFSAGRFEEVARFGP